MNVAGRRMWLAPNLPDEEGERREGEGRERREFGRSRFRSKTPKTETNHDNDSHETLFQTRATHHIVLKAPQDVCVPLCSFPKIH